MMRISYSLGSLLTVKQILQFSKKLNMVKPDVIWIPETWGMENFSMLSSASLENNFSKIGSSIINIYSRSPTQIAMGAATVDTISNERLILGLGTSTKSIVEQFHGKKFVNPVQRMKEYIEIIRLALTGNKINYSGKLLSLENFSLLIKPPRVNIPIYLAAVNQKMINLAWEIGDGVIFYLRPKNEIKSTLEIMQKNRRIDSTLQIITCVHEDSEKAVERAKKTLAFYISVGEIYRVFLSNNGYKNEVESIYNEYTTSGLENNFKLVTDKMVKDLCISGTPTESLYQLKKFRDTGIDLPIIQFNPIGNVETSFNTLVKTFGDE